MTIQPPALSCSARSASTNLKLVRLMAAGATAAGANVTVVDWEVLSATCEGRCFYDDGIHLTQSGQNYYADVIGRVLAQP